MKFDLPKDKSSIIKVIGVGGGGGNAVNHMYQQGIEGVDFIVCNTDVQVLDTSPVSIKVQLGKSLTEGLGAGSKPDTGRNAAIESIDDIRALLETNTKMLFITAGMGGGTGTGAAPVIAETARELGILTVGIVTIPFSWEGPKKRNIAVEGINALRQHVDSLIVVNNDKLREIYGNLPFREAFAHADDVLTIGARGIAEIITRTGYINVDFEDVKSVMTDSGVAIMGSATAEGEGRATKAVEAALSSPLLNDNVITGAKNVLLNITFGTNELLMDEISDITDYIKAETQSTDDIIWGFGQDESLGESICVTIIATGFDANGNPLIVPDVQQKVKKLELDDDVPTMLTKPIEKEEETVEDEPRLKEEPDMNEPGMAEEPAAELNAEEERESPVLDEDKTTVQSGLFSTNDAAETPEKAEDQDLPEQLGETTETPELAEPEDKSDDNGEIRRWKDMLVEKNPVEDETDEQTLAKNEPSQTGQVVEFDLTGAKPADADSGSNEPYLKSGEEAENPGESPQVEEPVAGKDEQKTRARSRISKLRELSMKLRTPSGISDLENEPAYKRKNVKLDEQAHSSESEISRFTLSESDEEGEESEKKTDIRPDNSFLHDNVD